MRGFRRIRTLERQMPRMRVCSQPGCPKIQATPRCTEHTREVDRARGSRQQRGYTAAHDRLREQWKPKVDLGQVDCARCRALILPGDPWALDHNDDRTGYLGPSHKRCNDSAGGRAAHQT